MKNFKGKVLCVCLCVCLLCLFVCVCMCVHVVRAYMWTSMCAYMCIHIHVYYIYIYIYIYIVDIHNIHTSLTLATGTYSRWWYDATWYDGLTSRHSNATAGRWNEADATTSSNDGRNYASTSQGSVWTHDATSVSSEYVSLT